MEGIEGWRTIWSGSAPKTSFQRLGLSAAPGIANAVARMLSADHVLVGSRPGMVGDVFCSLIQHHTFVLIYLDSERLGDGLSYFSSDSQTLVAAHAPEPRKAISFLSTRMKSYLPSAW